MQPTDLTPTALIVAAATYLLNSGLNWVRRRLSSKWDRLYDAIAIGVNAAWETYVKNIKREKGNPGGKLTQDEARQAHDIALSIAEQHAIKTCPKLWRKLTNAQKSYLIKRAIQKAKARAAVTL